MAIDLVPPLNRKSVLWLGDPIPEQVSKAFEQRNYAITRQSEDALESPAVLSGVSAVILCASEKKPMQVTRLLTKYWQTLLNHDCLVILLGTNKSLSSLKTAVQLLKMPAVGQVAPEESIDEAYSLPPAPHIQYFSISENLSWDDIANFVFERPRGPAPNSLLNVHFENNKELELSSEAQLLLQRAFFDCQAIHLKSLEGGKSGAGVFRAYAELSGLEGQWTQPYFVKIGPRKDIVKEYEIYLGNVNRYIPFHLGPHLVRERCGLGSEEGIIVGDYIDESESLKTAAADGRGASAIACLFDRTLLSWHKQAKESDRPLADLLSDYVPKAIDATRMTRAREFGASLDLEELLHLIAERSETPVFVGSIHGDLHASNVMVRGTDAIVIDFLRHVPDSALLRDAASLEASLLVEGFEKDERTIEEWFESIKALYAKGGLQNRIACPPPHNPSYWFYCCILQIRRYGMQWEACTGQYAATLALSLLEKASKDNDAKEPEASRRAAAYFFAESVLKASNG